MNKWIAHESNGDKDINLFAFPHAGGTAAFFATWGRILKDIFSLTETAENDNIKADEKGCHRQRSDLPVC